jgi:hypothetical protein
MMRIIAPIFIGDGGLWRIMEDYGGLWGIIGVVSCRL